MGWKAIATRALPVAALLTAAAGTYALFAITPASATAKTVVQTVGPLDANGALNPSYRVTRRLGHGTCQLGSYQVGAAYRCASPGAGPVILDPCWPLAADPSTMVCQAKPWQAKVVEVHVAATAAGGPSTHPASQPWGLRIGARIRCLRDVGAVLRVEGNLLAYHCSHHRDVIGALQTSGATWRAHVYRSGAPTATGEKSIGWQAVTIAWEGEPLNAPGASPTPTPTPTPTVSLLPTGVPTITASPSVSPLATRTF
ncbi:MAG TPA: hypothetical protein VHB69_04350 [Mycobacteriales bacterium]|nr:hypothetical protein [Mycobacteriales bacterium]